MQIKDSTLMIQLVTFLYLGFIITILSYINPSEPTFKKENFFFEIKGYYLPIIKHVIRDIPERNIKIIKHYNERMKFKGDEILVDTYFKPNYNLPYPYHYNTFEEVMKYASKLIGDVIQIKNFYVNRDFLFSDGKRQIQWKESFPWNRIILDNTPGFLIGTCHNLIAIGHGIQCEYGHFFIDCLAPLMLLPKDIWYKSYFLINSNNTYVTEILNKIGIPYNRQIVINDFQWIFAENVFLTHKPYTYFQYTCTSFKNLSFLLRAKFNTLNNKISDHCLYNRDKKYRRHILNFDTLTNQVRKSFPKIEWIILDDNNPTVKETAIIWSKIQLIFSITGSNLIRAFFMNPGSIIIDIQLNFNDFSIQSIAICNEIRMLIFSLSRYDHYNTKKLLVPISHSLMAIKIGLYAEIHGEWPQKNSQFIY